MAKCVSKHSAGANRLKGGGWPLERDELMMSKNPKRSTKFPWPGEAADRAREHISGLSEARLWGMGEEKKLSCLVPSQDFSIFFNSQGIEKDKERGKQNSY